MARRRREPACPRCGNEQDLLPWMNGQTFCVECLRCPHGPYSTHICLVCVCALYARATFQGWRIVDLEVYVRDAWRDYGLRSIELLTCTFFETEQILENGEAWQAKESTSIEVVGRVRQPPPHHRSLTAWGESR